MREMIEHYEVLEPVEQTRWQVAMMGCSVGWGSYRMFWEQTGFY